MEPDMDSRLEQRGSAGSTSVAHGCAARGAGSVTAVPCDGLFRFAETNNFASLSRSGRTKQLSVSSPRTRL